MNAAHRMTDSYRNEVIEQAKALPKTDRTPYVGRLHYNRRRFSWVIRFDAEARTFDDGSRWQPVELIA